MNTQAEVNVSEPGFKLIRRGERFYVRIEDATSSFEKVLDQTRRQDLQGEIALPNARLKYWYDETKEEWHFIHWYEFAKDDHNSITRISQHILVNAEGVQEATVGEAPEEPNAMLFNFNLAALLTAISVVVVLGLFYYVH